MSHLICSFVEEQQEQVRLGVMSEEFLAGSRYVPK